MFATTPIPSNKRTLAARGDQLTRQGTKVAVFRLLPAPHFEGWAVIEGPASGHHRFRVRFAEDPLIRDRFVHPDWQSDPMRALSLLQQLWAAETTAAVADFFPEA